MPIMTILETTACRAAAAGRRSAASAGAIAEPVARHDDLRDDFTGRQIADQLLRAGMAEACS